MHKALTTVFLVLALSAGTASAQQWDIKGPQGFDLETRQLFSIFTSGQARNENALPIKEFGTGFAVAPRVLITAKHVTREDRVFENIATDDRVIIPGRNVELTYAEKETLRAAIMPFVDVAVTQSPQTNTDAARLDLHTDEFNTAPLPLSICKLETGQDYYLLKFQQGVDQQGKVLASKDKRSPRAVALEFDSGVTARRGNLRRFKLKSAMSEDDPAKPVPGDSGGPVIDSDGNVVGLLTALQGDVFLWVTPTESFLDLVPAKIRAQARCSPDVEGSLGYMVGTDKRLDTDLINLRARVKRDVEAMGARLSTIESNLIAELEATRNRLALADKNLAEAHARLAAQNKRLDSLIKETSSLSRRVLDELAFRSSRESMDHDELQSMMDKLRNSAPVVPVMLQMREDLGDAVWRFSVTPGGGGAGIPSLNILFSRRISLPPDHPELIFCMRPMLELAEGVRRKDHREDDFRSIYYFIESESTFFTGGLTTCKPSGVDDALRARKQASYSFSLEFNQRVDDSLYPHLEFGDPVGRYYYGYVFEPDAIEAAEADSFGVAPMLHRFLFRVGSQDLSDVDCYYFPQEDINAASEAVKAFITDADEKVREQYRCSQQ
ncbi:serine protease [Aliishimia ponticola]|uniref:Serine protease n=1 Tax=Aliishimia ponticola TaxID=2499833 RepID=A0A4S4N8P4_9RHOB|nr:serine protease [Aliishimia ponticola]THH34717.1 serine protease [Aliishimia ponticola]